MDRLQRIFNIAKADFLERTRQYGFFITLIVTLYGASLFLPEKQANYVALAVRGYRGIYNSAWVGLCVAVSTSLLLGLAGFYLVKNAIERDEKSRVGQLFAASPTSKLEFIVGKVTSNFFVLTTIVMAAMLSSVMMFYLRAESSGLDLVQLIKPFILITLPTMLMVSAVAILFENIKWLKGGVGNVLYFFVWITTLIIPVNMMAKSGGSTILPFVDTFGFYKVIALIDVKVFSLFPNSPTSSGLFSSAGSEGAKTFLWSGLDWTVDMYLGRFFWIAVSMAIVLLSTMLFNRFDESEKMATKGFKKSKSKSASSHGKNLKVMETEWVESLSKMEVTINQTNGSAYSFLYVLMAELKLMLKGLNPWWYVGIVGLNLLAIVIPESVTVKFILPLCWIFPIFILSAQGVREYTHKTSEIIFSCMGTLRFQFTAMMLSGVIVTALCGIGPITKFLISGNQTGSFSWLMAIFFIPFFATCCGVWSKTPRLFEGIYIVLWYIGPINGLLYFDFMGVVNGSAEKGMPIVFGVIALISLVLSLIQRKYLSKST